jgi:MFS family permease
MAAARHQCYAQAARQRAICVTGYWLVCIGTLGVQYAFGTLYVHILEIFPEVTRAQAALVGALCAGIMDGVAAFAGMAVQRIGNRRSCFLGALLSALGLIGSAYANRAGWWVLLLTYSIAVGVGHALSLYAAIMLMPAWFDRGLARAHTVANTGAAITPLVIGSSARRIVGAFGWRDTLLLLAAADAAILGVAGLLLITPPSRFASTTVANTAASTSNQVEVCAAAHKTRVGLCEVVRTRRFQLLSACAFLFGNGAWINVVHIVRMGIDEGIARDEADQLLLWLALGSLTMRVPVGIAADCVGRRRVVTGVLSSYSLVTFGCAYPPWAASWAYLRLFAFCVGGLSGCTLSLLPTLPNELLPTRIARLASAAILSPVGVGFIVGPTVAGEIVQGGGRYTGAKLLAAACLASAAATVGLLTCCDSGTCCNNAHGSKSHAAGPGVR